MSNSLSNRSSSCPLSLSPSYRKVDHSSCRLRGEQEESSDHLYQPCPVMKIEHRHHNQGNTRDELTHFTKTAVNQSINQVYFQINMYKNEQKVHISQIDRKKVEVEVSNL